jgi:hypothetical protein
MRRYTPQKVDQTRMAIARLHMDRNMGFGRRSTLYAPKTAAELAGHLHARDVLYSGAGTTQHSLYARQSTQAAIATQRGYIPNPDYVPTSEDDAQPVSVVTQTDLKTAIVEALRLYASTSKSDLVDQLGEEEDDDNPKDKAELAAELALRNLQL